MRRWGLFLVIGLAGLAVGFLGGVWRDLTSGGALAPEDSPARIAIEGNAEGLSPDPSVVLDLPGNIARGQVAPHFTVRTMGGGRFALADQAGKPTVILFMASWCYSCIEEAQSLGALYAEFKDRGLTVVALDVQDGDTDVELQAFREQAGNPDYVWAFDDGYSVTQAYGVRSLQTTVVIDEADRVVYYDQSITPLETLREVVVALLR
ncbi:MAG: peroxiredoxin family protein [Anaerolineales bacterium]